MSAVIWIPLALCGVGVTAFTIVGALGFKGFGGVGASTSEPAGRTRRSS